MKKNRKVSNFESTRIDFLNQTNYSNTPKNINSSNQININHNKSITQIKDENKKEIIYYQPHLQQGNIKKENKVLKFLKEKQKVVITFSIIMILILISIFAPMIGNTDGSNIKNVDYTLNEDNSGYTMHMDMGLFNVYGKPPYNLKIPETHKGLPITNIKVFSCEHNIETIQGSKNLETIDNNAFFQYNKDKERCFG